MNLSKHHTAPRYSSTLHLSTSYHHHLPKNDVPTYVLVSTDVLLFAPHLWHSKFLTLHLLTFKLSCLTRELLTSASTRTYMPSFYFVKIVNPKSAIIQSWIHKTNHSYFAIYDLLVPTAYGSYKKMSHIIHNVFQPLFNFRISESIVQHFLTKGRPNFQEG